MLTRIPLLIFFAIFTFFCNLQVSGQEILFFSKLTQLNGLSNNTINDIKQDTAGYIWIATNKGLNRFDGSEFKTYSSSNSEILKSDYISCLEVDEKNRIWFGTSDGGLHFLNHAEDRIHNIPGISLDVNVIVETKSGAFWIGTKDGLFLMQEKLDGQFSFLQYSKLACHSIEIQDENLWIGTTVGVYFLEVAKNRLTEIMTETLHEELIFDIEIIREKELWIATRYQGVIIYDLEKKQRIQLYEKFNTSESFNFKDARKLYRGTNDKLYIGTDGSGLIQYDIKSQTLARFTKSISNYSLLSNTIFSIYEDKDENIWLGHIRKGISIINKDKDKVDIFFRENLAEDYSSILCIQQDKDKNLLCGTDGKGLFKIDKSNGKHENLNFSADLNQAYVQSIFEDSEENLWVGTFSKGLFLQIDGKEAERVIPEANDIRTIEEDKDGNIWIATNGEGLFNYRTDTQKIKRYQYSATDKNAIGSNYILSMSLAGEKVYLATDGGGLNILDRTTGLTECLIYNPNDDNSILGDNLIALFVENPESIWVGSTSGITNVVEKDGQRQYFRYSFGDSSFGRFVLGILVDDDGETWISTDEGLYKLEQKDKTFTKVNLGSPFSTTEFHYNSCLKTPTGKLFFGSINGLVSFFPSQVFRKNENRKVVITNFQTFGKEKEFQQQKIAENLQTIKLTGKIQVEESVNLIKIDFADIRLPTSEETEYLVFLENHQDDWQYCGKNRSVTYKNLPAGDYVFQVKSADKNNENITSFELSVLAPFWKSSWAFLFYTFLVLGILYVFSKYFRRWKELKNKLKEEKLTRERTEELRKMQVTFFTNISHDLRTPLTLISGNLRRLASAEKAKNFSGHLFDVIENNLNRLLQLSNELLDFRKIATGDFKLDRKQEDIISLLKESYHAFYDHAVSRQIEFKQHGVTAEVLPIFFDRDQFEKVLFNLLSNAFKFTSRQGHITLQLDNSLENELKISVSNTGKSLSAQQQQQIFDRFYHDTENIQDENIGPGIGIGLSIVKDIVDLHQGRVEVKSDAKLTVFSVFLPKNKTDYVKKNNENLIPNSTEHIEDYQGIEKIISRKSTTVFVENEFKDVQILVVEDNYELRKFIVSSLNPDYLVSEAENGKQALESILRDLPDLIISDVMMPEIDGISLCFKLKTNIKTSHIPVILLTARKSRYFKMKGLETGADDYLQKPFYEDELQVRIKNLLRTKKNLQRRFQLNEALRPEETILNSPDKEFLQKLCDIIEKHLDDTSLKAQTISQEIQMSHSLVYKKLKALTGLSLVEFIRDYRLQKAEMLLLQNRISIAEVCYCVGFSDRSYFSVCFKKKYKMSPREYLNFKKKSN